MVNTNELRPSSIKGIIGCDQIKSRLLVSIKASIERQEACPHILLSGPPGLGKTTWAMAIANELGTDFKIANGAVIKSARDLLPLLTKAEPYSVIFIDEQHRMPIEVEELLYTAMEDFRVDIPMGEGRFARTVSIDLNPITIIGATTISGMLSAPLLSRFIIHETIDFYGIDDLSSIALSSAKKLSVTIDNDATNEIAKRSRGTPRILNGFLRWCRDLAQSRRNNHITLELAQEAFDTQCIDSLGLNKTDRDYMNTIIDVYENKPVGIETIASTLNINKMTLVESTEPYLLRQKLIARTPRGRIVLPNGILHLNKNSNE